MGSNPSRNNSTTVGGAPPSLHNNHHLTLNSLADDSCRNIFSYLTFNDGEIIHLRTSCRLFRDALPSPPCWTSFPHPKYNTLDKLFRALNMLWNEVSNNEEEDDKDDNKRSTFFPHLVLLGEGTYHLNHFFSARQATTMLTCPLTLIGVSREATVIQGGVEILGTRKYVSLHFFLVIFFSPLFFFFPIFKRLLWFENSQKKKNPVFVHFDFSFHIFVLLFFLSFFPTHTHTQHRKKFKIFHLTIRRGAAHGIFCRDGMDLMLTNVLIEECILSGLCAKACRIKCTNLEVTGCGFSGILSTYNSTILLKGTYQKKKI